MISTTTIYDWTICSSGWGITVSGVDSRGDPVSLSGVDVVTLDRDPDTDRVAVRARAPRGTMLLGTLSLDPNAGAAA